MLKFIDNIEIWNIYICLICKKIYELCFEWVYELNILILFSNDWNWFKKC